MTYQDVSLMIDGAWTKGAKGRTIPVINPATEEVIGQVAHAETADLDRALAAADKGFRAWKKVSAYERYKIMRKAADLMRQRVDEIATMMTMEQGKPLFEAKVETNLAADIIDWMAEEGRRTYGRVVPARAENVYQLVIKEPVGPVAAGSGDDHRGGCEVPVANLCNRLLGRTCRVGDRWRTARAGHDRHCRQHDQAENTSDDQWPRRARGPGWLMARWIGHVRLAPRSAR